VTKTALPTTGSGRFREAAVGRADLMRWLHHAETTGVTLERVAAFAGFELRPTEEEKIAPPPFVPPGPPEPAEPLTPAQVLPRRPARWFHVVEHEMGEPPGEAELDNEPLSIRGVGDFSEEDLEPSAAEPRFKPLPLTRWERLWPALKRALSAPSFGEVDLNEAAERIARGDVLRRLPRLRRLRWSADLTVLIDLSPRVYPFGGDFESLCCDLARVRGRLGLDARLLDEIPDGPYTPWRKHPERPRPWRMPVAGARVLILSDLGMLDRSRSGQGEPKASRVEVSGSQRRTIGTGRAGVSQMAPRQDEQSIVREHWHRLGRRFKAAGIRPLVLAPVSADHVETDLAGLYRIVPWTRAGRLGPVRGTRRRDEDQPVPVEPRWAGALKTLLTLLSPAVRIEPELLRAVRHLLPPEQADSGCEAEFWLHPDVVVAPWVSCWLREQSLEAHRAAFRLQPPELQREVYKLLRLHHAHLFPAILHEETLAWADSASDELVAESREDIAGSALFLHRYARLLHRRRMNPDSLVESYGRRHLARTGSRMRRCHRYLSVVFAVANQEALRSGESPPIPEEFDRAEVHRALALPGEQPCPRVLLQRGEELILVEADGAEATRGSFFAKLYLPGPRVRVAVSSPDEKGEWRNIEMRGSSQAIARLHQDTREIRIEGGQESLVILGSEKPSWADGIGRDPAGLFAEVPWLGIVRRLNWSPPASGRPGQWTGEPPLGSDDVGLYADLEFRGVVQRFRRIVPGRFLMGSPAEEAGRRDDETEHEVTLTRGYWLGDTACTQSLWERVMGSNPSHFRDDPRNPVEGVSWEDVQEFLGKLNADVPGLVGRLPSEAEWEYACRAGTRTPFSFGSDITTKEVNYDGTFPYAGGEKGKYRRRTVAVGTLPANAWGLYEMHGNVWEWCQDWYGPYAEGSQVDPLGPAVGGVRVLRGGSWFNIGRNVRSAYRSGYAPSDRHDNVGIRLALGEAASTRRDEGPAGQPRGRRGGQDDRGRNEAGRKGQ